MPAKRKDYSSAVESYARGDSIEKVAIAHDVTRQAMWKILSRRGVKMRQPVPAVSLVWKGAKYSLRENGYMARTIENRRYLHQDVWELHNGPVPAGYEIHHKDEDKLNNEINNLELLSEAEHGARHGFGGNQYVPSLGRRQVK